MFDDAVGHKSLFMSISLYELNVDKYAECA